MLLPLRSPCIPQRQRRSFMRRLRASLRHIVYAETVLEESRRPPYDATYAGATGLRTAASCVIYSFRRRRDSQT
eukprot:6185194-Pleurochrysis_carterae.AAC.2